MQWFRFHYRNLAALVSVWRRSATVGLARLPYRTGKTYHDVSAERA